MQARTTTNPAQHKHVKIIFDYERYEPSYLGEYNVFQTWDTGLRPCRSSRSSWMVPKLRTWEAWIDSNTEFRTVLDTWSAGTWSGCIILGYEEVRGDAVAYPDADDDPLHSRLFLDAEQDEVAWLANTDPLQPNPPATMLIDTSAAKELDCLVLKPLSISLGFRQSVSPLAEDPDPPIGFRLAKGVLECILTYDWIEVSNATFYKLAAGIKAYP